MVNNDKTVLDPDATVPEGGKTVLDSAATVLETGAETVPDGGTTMLEAALSDAAVQTGPPVSNAAIQKGSTILDTYRVESDAIEGGMGSVWRVHHTGWNVDLAMKRPQAKCFSTEKSKADFIHECEAWINLGLHPNIVSCYYVREISGTPSIFSEWMDGGSLESAIQKGTLYEGAEAAQKERLLDIAIQFARGLHYAHEAGLIHQDVKPDNVLLTKEGEAKVADFGLARARAVLTALEGDVTMNENADGGKTMLSPSGGYTPAYCSMEQMDGRELTRRTDIYSWAVSVMEMYLGSRPWANGVVAGLGCRSYFENTRISLPEALKELLTQCLDSEPENRPHDFEEIEVKLHKIYEAETGGAYPRPAPKAAADTADSLNNRALSFLDLGKDEEAEACWGRALSADAMHPLANYNLNLFLWENARIDGETAVMRMQNAGASEERLNKINGRYEPQLSCSALLSDFNAYAQSLAVISDDGSYFACSRKTDRQVLMVEVRSTADGALLSSVSTNGGDALHQIAFLPGGPAEIVYSTDTVERLTLWNWETGATFCQYEAPTAFKTITQGRGPYARQIQQPVDENTFDDFTVMPSKKQVLAISRNKGLRLWPLEPDKPMRQIACFTGGTALALTADGGRAFVARGQGIEAYDVASGRLEFQLSCTFQSAAVGVVTKISLTPDGRRLIAVAEAIEIWDIGTQKRVMRIPMTGGRFGTRMPLYKTICLSPDGRSILAAINEDAWLFRARDGMLLHHFPAEYPSGKAGALGTSGKAWRLTAAAFSTDGDILLLREIGSVHIYRGIDCQKEFHWELGRVETVDQRMQQESRFDQLLRQAGIALERSDIQSALDVLEEAGCVSGMEENDALFDLWRQAGKFCCIEGVRRVGKPLDLPGNDSFALRFLPDGTLAAFNAGQISCWDLSARRIEREFSRKIGSSDGNPEHGMDYRSQPLHPAGVCAQFDWETRSDANGTSNVSILEVFDAKTGARICAYAQDFCRYESSAVVVSPCGEYAYRLTATKNETEQRDNGWRMCECVNTFFKYALRTGKCERQTTILKELRRGDHYVKINSLSVSPDGGLLAVLLEENTVVLLDAHSGETVSTLPVVGGRWARFLPGGKRLLLVDARGQYRILWLDTRQCEASFALVAAGENSVGEEYLDVSPDGCYVGMVQAVGELHIARVFYHYRFPGWRDDDERLHPYLSVFLHQHPDWTDADFDALIDTLQSNGLGFLRPDSVRKHLSVLKSPEKPLLEWLWEQHPNGEPKAVRRQIARQAPLPAGVPRMGPAMPPISPPRGFVVPQPPKRETPVPEQKPDKKRGLLGLLGKKK